MHRYYLPDFRVAQLDPEEAHHCRHVLRQHDGDIITVFDGRGQEAQAVIAGTEGAAVRLKILQPSATPALPAKITLAQAITKQHMDFIVQKATELGVAVIAPLFSERTVIAADRGATGKWTRWRTICLDACKQSGNNWLPELLPPRPAADFLAAPGTFDLALIGSLQPGAQPLKEILAETRAASSRDWRQGCSVLVLIGPEGDFTPAELALARSSGCRPLSLGPLVLRADTAALYALSILHHELNNP